MLSVIVNSDLLRKRSMSNGYVVSVLWFRNRDPGNALLQWVLLVKPISAEHGTRHAVSPQYSGIDWTHTSVPNYKLDAEERFLGSMSLGSVKDVAAFEAIITATDMPTLKETSQDWVRKVVEEAVKKELLPESALNQLGKVPVHL